MGLHSDVTKYIAANFADAIRARGIFDDTGLDGSTLMLFDWLIWLRRYVPDKRETWQTFMEVLMAVIYDFYKHKVNGYFVIQCDKKGVPPNKRNQQRNRGVEPLAPEELVLNLDAPLPPWDRLMANRELRAMVTAFVAEQLYETLSLQPGHHFVFDHGVGAPMHMHVDGKPVNGAYKVHRARHDRHLENTLGESDIGLLWMHARMCQDLGTTPSCTIQSTDSDMIPIALAYYDGLKREGKATAQLLVANKPSRVVNIGTLWELVQAQYQDHYRDPTCAFLLMCAMCETDFTIKMAKGVGVGVMWDTFNGVRMDKCVKTPLKHNMARLDAVHRVKKDDGWVISMSHGGMGRLLRACIAAKLGWPIRNFSEGEATHVPKWDRLRSHPKRGKSIPIPNDRELEMRYRQLQWVLHYWINGPLSLADDPLATDDAGLSLYGWTKNVEADAASMETSRGVVSTQAISHPTTRVASDVLALLA
jgi:hypothetical protein